jgi:hypothetical protein
MIDKILEKPIITDKYGNLIVDLFQPSYDGYLDNVEYRSVGFITSDMAMRIDVFAEVYGYGSDDMVNILKYNRIQNPFSIKEDDIIAIPKDPPMQRLRVTPDKRNIANEQTSNINNMKRKFFDAMTPFIKSGQINNTFESFRKKYEDLENVKKLEEFKQLQDSNDTPTSLFPPNVNDSNKKEIKVNPNGTLTLGESVADTPKSCGVKTLTKAELLNSLIKNRR